MNGARDAYVRNIQRGKLTLQTRDWTSIRDYNADLLSMNLPRELNVDILYTGRKYSCFGHKYFSLFLIRFYTFSAFTLSHYNLPMYRKQ